MGGLKDLNFWLLERRKIKSKPYCKVGRRYGSKNKKKKVVKYKSTRNKTIDFEQLKKFSDGL